MISYLFCVVAYSNGSTTTTVAPTIESTQSLQPFEHDSVEFDRACESNAEQRRLGHIRFGFGTRSSRRANTPSIGTCSRQSQSHHVNDIRLVGTLSFSLLASNRPTSNGRPFLSQKSTTHQMHINQTVCTMCRR